jgi:hypothetical protein
MRIVQLKHEKQDLEARFYFNIGIYPKLFWPEFSRWFYIKQHGESNGDGKKNLNYPK